MYVRSVASQISEWFWHESGPEAMLFGHATNHPFEKGIAIGGGQGFGIGPVYFELAVRIFMIVSVRVPPQFLHETEQTRHYGEVTVERTQVVAGLRECVERVPWSVFSRGTLFEEHKLRFHTDVDDITMFTCSL